MNSVEMLMSLGGKVGSTLIGKDEDDERVLLILEIQHTRVLAKCIKKDGKEWDGHEANWSLTMREWKLLKQ